MTRTMSASTCWSVPDPEGFAVVLGVPEIDRAGEELPAAIDAAGGEQLLGADDPQLFAEFGAEHVLSAVAARQRQIGGAVVAAAREVGDQLRVLIVGMRRDVEDAAQFAKTAQVLQDGGGGLRLRCRRRRTPGRAWPACRRRRRETDAAASPAAGPGADDAGVISAGWR